MESVKFTFTYKSKADQWNKKAKIKFSNNLQQKNYEPDIANQV